MSTSKNKLTTVKSTKQLMRTGSKRLSISEIKLDLPATNMIKTKNLPSNKTMENPFKAGMQCGSSSGTISIQNLEFPKVSDKKPIVNVPSGARGSLKVVEEASMSTPEQKKHGYGFSSSTNSNFTGWIFGVPKREKARASISSSDMQKTNDLLLPSSLLTSPMPKWTEMDHTVTSQEMADSQHDGSKPRLNFKGPEWRKPCKESFVAGAPRPFIGTCPPNYEKLSKMSKSRQKFFLTQDPRKKHCLVNPEVLRRKAYSKKREFDALTKMVKHADNICAGSDTQSSESFICEIIDLENPMQLDFQGMDYKNTYEHDEQDIQNTRNYHRVCRYMERRRTKAETGQKVEDQIQNERLAVPDCFAIENRYEEVISEVSSESIRCGKLFRSTDKPFNKKRILDERNRRHDRYKDLYLKRKQRTEEENKKHEEEKVRDEAALASTLAQKNFNDVVGNINDAIHRSFKMERLLRKNEIQRRIFPHTMRETMKFRTQLKETNRIKRDKARVKQEFYIERLGQVKSYPEAKLEISSDSPKPSNDSPISEQSSDDEDDIEVGKKGDNFKLRGFHFKLGDQLRGKRHKNETLKGARQEKGCITREQWLAELAPKKTQIRLDVEEGILKIKSPDDPDMVLFNPQFGFKQPKAKYSAVQQYHQKRLGRHYDRVKRKNLKLARPRLRYSVKKFNLITFLYGNATQRLREMKNAAEKKESEKHSNMITTLEYMQTKQREKQEEEQAIKQKRLKLLGIECREIKKSRLQTLCENSESDTNSDYVPDPEPDIQSAVEDDDSKRHVERIPLRMRGNMPAPKNREKTLNRHPRYPRDYAGERVPSELFDDAVKTTGIPHLRKMADDKFEYANVELKKRPYADMFEARHHHDHWNATELKLVDVHYQAEQVKPKVTQKMSKLDKVTMQNFKMANPPCNSFVDMDLTMPKYDIDAMITSHLKKSERSTEKTTKVKTKDICKPHDYVFHSRQAGELDNLDYPGREEYLKFLHEIRTTLQESKESKAAKDDEAETLTIDKEGYIKELQEDLNSIESCLTSLSSSVCTNLTNDSGSFLLMEGKTKVPLDYIRKSLIPFEELHRSRFKAVPIDVDAEESDPFKMLPFPGQRKTQMLLSMPADSFFTFNTRIKNGLRLRLEVPVEDVRNKLLGCGHNKFYGAVTTDIDENYVDELKNRPPVKMFNFKTGRTFIKDAIRLKFESMLIQGQIVRTKIYDRLNEQHWETMQRTKLLYERLFAKWEKREYEAAMSVVHQVKSYYDITDLLKREYRELERQQLILNMDIVFIEGHWIQRIMLQNFHYLLADQDWRIQNDWIHRIDDIEDGELESFEDSIAKRNIVNIRQREKDDAWAIKTFFDEVYLQNKHPILIVFPDAESFLKGIENLKLKTFVLLLELHFTLSIHTELHGRLETFQEWCIQDLREKEEYVDRKCSKKYFMEDRAEELKNRTLEFLGQPIELSYNDDSFNRDRAVIAEVWREIVPANIRGSSDQEQEPVDMVAMMSDAVIELISKFENIPVEQSRSVEAKLRRRLAYDRKLSFQAYQIEKRIEIEMKKVRKNLEPPYQKPKRVGKLRRFHIKKKIKHVTIYEQRISEHTKFFFRAFHDEGDILQLDDARDSLYVADTIQDQIVPFYFDYFLKLNGYTPNYNFKTRTEMSDGPEINRLQVRSLVPEIMEKMERWEAQRKKTMEDNIARNPKMYENVNY